MERKRNENKTLKKELDNIKLYGSHLKHTDIQRATSPLRKGIDKDKHEPKGNQQPLAAQSGSKGESQAGMPKKYLKGLK